LSDETGTIAGPLGTYSSVSMRKDADYIALLARQKEAERIVLGLPLNMNGTKGERVSKTEAFGRVLHKITGIEVVYKDERLSTVAAERSLSESGMRREKQKNAVDTAAAQIILQSYLDGMKFR
ncbi:MAG: Holliday junction resolvase RuvX, partial [Defluviitaleaceae bacterium]|nr:Holliday junction resolvase RuvX [Defluviitaleaceae bacterium]